MAMRAICTPSLQCAEGGTAIVSLGEQDLELRAAASDPDAGHFPVLCGVAHGAIGAASVSQSRSALMDTCPLRAQDMAVSCWSTAIMIGPVLGGWRTKLPEAAEHRMRADDDGRGGHLQGLPRRQVRNRQLAERAFVTAQARASAHANDRRPLAKETSDSQERKTLWNTQRWAIQVFWFRNSASVP
jgi:hypothetical protein